MNPKASAASARPQGEADPLLEVRRLSVNFGTAQVLKDVDLAVRKGEVIAIIGPSGSGKSTLCRVIVGLEKLAGGEIFFRGEMLAACTPAGKIVHGPNSKSLRLAMGLVFQHFTLFPHLTVMKNLILAPRKVRKVSASEAEAQAMDVLSLVHLVEKKDKYPSTLSGGQKQRVAIARELAMQREILLFDEPTSALDPELVREVLVTIKDLAAAGTTMVLVTHEIAFARQVADRVIFMADGEIVEQGTAEQLLDHPQNARTQSFLR